MRHRESTYRTARLFPAPLTHVVEVEPNPGPVGIPLCEEGSASWSLSLRAMLNGKMIDIPRSCDKNYPNRAPPSPLSRSSSRGENILSFLGCAMIALLASCPSLRASYLAVVMVLTFICCLRCSPLTSRRPSGERGFL